MHAGTVVVHPHPVGSHRHPAHRFDAAGDHDIVGAGGDALRGEMHGLLARAAFAVDHDRRHMHRKSGREHRHPGDVGLLAGLRDAADDDVVDERRIERVSRDDRLEDGREQINGMHG